MSRRRSARTPPQSLSTLAPSMTQPAWVLAHDLRASQDHKHIRGIEVVQLAVQPLALSPSHPFPSPAPPTRPAPALVPQQLTASVSTASPPAQALTDAAQVEQSPLAKNIREKKVTLPLSREANSLLLRFIQDSQCGLVASILNDHVTFKARRGGAVEGWGRLVPGLPCSLRPCSLLRGSDCRAHARPRLASAGGVPLGAPPRGRRRDGCAAL